MPLPMHERGDGFGDRAARARRGRPDKDPSHGIARNPGMELDLGWLEAMRHVNRSALERRVASLTKRRSIKADNQAAWLLRAVSVMDLTTLNSNDTDERVAGSAPRRSARSGRISSTASALPAATSARPPSVSITRSSPPRSTR